MEASAHTYPAHGFNDGLPNGKASGTLTVSDTGLSFQTGDVRVSFSLEGVSFTLGGASNRLLFLKHAAQPEWSVYTSDLSILDDEKLNALPELRALLNQARGKRIFGWTAAAAAGLLVVAATALLLTNMDAVGGVIARRIPAQWEKELGDSAFKQYQVDSEILENAVTEQALGKLTMPLLDAVDSDRYTFRFYVSHATDVNAFALPGGIIVINSGLVIEADSANELLGVLAHEISHITEQHGLRNIISAAGIFIVADALLGDVSGVMAVLADALPLLINQSYSRAFEADADEKGLAVLAKARIDPNGLVSFFRKMAALERKQLEMIEDEEIRTVIDETLGFMSTHPSTETRIAELEASIANHRGPYRDLEAPFQLLKSEVEQFVTQQQTDEKGKTP